MLAGHCEYAECKKQVIQKISVEHAIFKYEMLSASTHEVYDSCRQICFYECVQEYFLYSGRISRKFAEAASHSNSILEELWEIYLKFEYLNADTWTQLEEILHVYVMEHGSKRTNN